MSTEGQFILLNVADDYLMNEFESSLRLSTNDYSSICHTPLFEGNILRFRALASLKLFELEQKLEDSETDMKQNFEYLTKAIESLENAIEIFKAERAGQGPDPNHYGIALSMYAIGFTYMTNASELCRSGRFEGLCEPNHVGYLVDSELEGRDKAREYF